MRRYLFEILAILLIGGSLVFFWRVRLQSWRRATTSRR
jgi:hypothetical protein